MRAVRAWLVVCGVVLGLAPPALADGPGVGHAHGGDARRLGDLRRGRPLGGQHEPAPPRAPTRSARPPTGTRPTGEAIPGCHRSKAAQAHIGGGVTERQPRLLRRAHEHDRARARARPSSRASTSTPTPPGRKGQALALERYASHSQRQGRRRDDRRQQLRLRGHRRALRDQLGDLPVVVEELLQRRLRHDVALHRDAPAAGDRQRPRRAGARPPGDDEGRLQATTSTRSSPRPTGPRSRAARASATARQAGRASPWAAAGSGTETRTGRTTRSWRR